MVKNSFPPGRRYGHVPATGGSFEGQMVMREQEGAETVALQVLGWLLADAGRAGAFLAATGAAPGDLRSAAADPVFLGAVLDFLLTDEAQVMAFCTDCGLGFDRPLAARAALPGGAQVHWT